MSSQVERYVQQAIENKIGDKLRASTPGLRLQVVSDGRLRADISLGMTSSYYDLASLTKPIFTVSAVMEAMRKRFIKSLNEPVTEYLSWWPAERTTTKHLLTHTSGLPAWRPFYKKIDRSASLTQRRQQLMKMLKGVGAKIPDNKTHKAEYSDLGFMVLGFLLEEVFEKDLASIWMEINKKLRLQHTWFHPANDPMYARSEYAPTQRTVWLPGSLKGEVNDNNAWALGGISTHAGLFGSIDDVTQWALLLRKAYRSAPSRLTTPKIAKSFCYRAIPSTQGDWGLGLMKPTKGHASCGRFFSLSSVGHLGFTGTSFWFDPQKDIIISMLANRYLPGQKHSQFKDLRPTLHDICVQALKS